MALYLSVGNGQQKDLVGITTIWATPQASLTLPAVVLAFPAHVLPFLRVF